MAKVARPPRCFGCALLCQRVKPRYEACKQRRLCDRIDAGLALFLYDVWDVAELEQANERLLRGAHELQRLRSEPFPKSEGELLEALRAAHFTLFQYAMPANAGSFRSEAVEYGGTGKNRREGAPVDRIEDELRQAFAVTERVSGPIETKAAVFLARLFRVHPFMDGNGRIGRHFVERVFAADRLVVGAWSTSGRERRKYLAALEFAHRNYVHRSFEATRYLAKWLRAQVYLEPADLEL